MIGPRVDVAPLGDVIGEERQAARVRDRAVEGGEAVPAHGIVAGREAQDGVRAGRLRAARRRERRPQALMPDLRDQRASRAERGASGGEERRLFVRVD